MIMRGEIFAQYFGAVSGNSLHQLDNVVTVYTSKMYIYCKIDGF